MELAIVAIFLFGVFVGAFGGVLVLSLCAMIGREDQAMETAPTPK